MGAIISESMGGLPRIQHQPLLQLHNRLGHSPACDRLLTRLEAVADSLLAESGLGAMLRQELRLSGDDVRELALQSGGDARMKLLAPAAQQRAVSRILHQYVA